MSVEKIQGCCTPADLCCCKVESIISVDERGQMVLPKDIRDRAQIFPADKLALISWEKDGQTVCLSLIKVENLESMVKSFLGPVANEIFRNK
jgi:antitoxin PrlF